MTRQATGQGPSRPPPGHVLQSHNSHNPPNHPQTAIDHQHSQPPGHQAPNQLHQHRTTTRHLPPTLHMAPTATTATPTACTQTTNSEHQQPNPRAARSAPEWPRITTPDSCDYSTSTAPNYNSHPMHLRCKQKLTKPFNFRV